MVRSMWHWRPGLHSHCGCCGEGGSSVDLQVGKGAEQGVVICLEFGQQIFVMDVRLAVHIHLSAQLHELNHLHFAWQHCCFFWRVALHLSRWPAVGCAVGSSSARRSSPRLGLASFCAVLRSAFFSQAGRMPCIQCLNCRPVTTATIVACSKGGPDAVVLPLVTVLDRVNCCPQELFKS